LKHLSTESVVGILFYTDLGIQSAMRSGYHVYVFYDTLDLVLPATGKRITDLGTEKGVANVIQCHNRSINQRSDIQTSVLIGIQGSEKG